MVYSVGPHRPGFEVGDPPASIEKAIESIGVVFINRAGIIHPPTPTASQYSMIPVGAVFPPESAAQAPTVVDPILRIGDPAPKTSVLPKLRTFPEVMPNTCVWLFNFPHRAAAAAGHFSIQGTMVIYAWVYPLFSLPTCMVCVSLCMVYFDASPSDISRGAISFISNATLWAGGVVVGRLREPAGRVADATAAAYASILDLIFSLLLIFLFTRQLVYRMYCILKRGFAGGWAAPDSLHRDI